MIHFDATQPALSSLLHTFSIPKSSKCRIIPVRPEAMTGELRSTVHLQIGLLFHDPASERIHTDNVKHLHNQAA